MSTNVDNINNFNGTSADKSKSSVASQAASKNYEDFLLLLTTQLKNQDPTAPTDTNQLTQQIATLSQVEQQLATNANLEQLISLYNSTQSNGAVNYIGKQIEAEGNQGALINGVALFSYSLDQAAANVKVTITDSTGRPVYDATAPTAAGRNDIIWNGKDNADVAVPDGVYNITVKATDAKGEIIKSSTYTTGIVTSVDKKEDGTFLSFGGISVPIDKVVSVLMAPNV